MAARVSLKDVAVHAGVSVPTASRVLSGSPRAVDPELAARVRASCDALGYKVNAAARALRRQSTDSIALVVPGISNPYFAELVAAYSRHLDRAGKRLVTIDTDDSAETEERQLRAMETALVDAVIVVPAAYRASRVSVARLARTHRVVQVDRTAEGVEAPSAQVDNAAGMHLLVEHLRAAGNRSILLVDAHEETSASIERRAAFEADSTPMDQILHMPAYTVASGTEAADRLLTDHAKVDAVICTADVVALGLLTALQQAGHRIPNDYALATFDGTYIAETAAPGLTTLASNAEKLVTASLALLDNEAPNNVTLVPQLIRRRSTDRAST